MSSVFSIYTKYFIVPDIRKLTTESCFHLHKILDIISLIAVK